MHQHPPSKPNISKTLIMGWLREISIDLPLDFKIQQLCHGTIYSRILNYYYPGIIPMIKVIPYPKTQQEYLHNLTYVQNALFQLKINIPFDHLKLTKKNYHDHFNTISTLYSHLKTIDQNYLHQEAKLHKKNLFPHSKPPLNVPSLHIPQQGYHFPINYNLPVWNPSSFLHFPTINSKENMSSPRIQSKPTKTCHEHFQSNQNAVLDRIKQILLKNGSDTEKVKTLKMLLGEDVEDDVIVLSDEDQLLSSGCSNNRQPMTQVKNGQQSNSQFKEEKSSAKGQERQRKGSFNSNSKGRKPFKV